MSVKRALYDYLTQPGDLPGLPAKLFTRPRVVHGLTVCCRNDARRWLRDRLGQEIYADRIPEGARHAAVEMRTVMEEPEYGLPGATDGTRELLILSINAYHGGDAALRADTIHGLLSLAVGGFYDGMWGTTYVGECLIESSSSAASHPGEGGDRWTHTRRLDLSVLYVDEATPHYAANELSVATRYADDGTYLQLIPDAELPEGRILTSATWTIRAGDSSGALLWGLAGNPAAAAGAANVTGTKLYPVLNRSALTLNFPLYVKLVVADDSTATAQAEVVING